MGGPQGLRGSFVCQRVLGRVDRWAATEYHAVMGYSDDFEIKMIWLPTPKKEEGRGAIGTAQRREVRRYREDAVATRASGLRFCGTMWPTGTHSSGDSIAAEAPKPLPIGTSEGIAARAIGNYAASRPHSSNTQKPTGSIKSLVFCRKLGWTEIPSEELCGEIGRITPRACRIQCYRGDINGKFN